MTLEALQDLRINHKWEAIDLENEQIQKAKTREIDDSLESFNNRDTSKQLLARSRYLLYKAPSNWTPTQAQRAQILFKANPDIHHGYTLVNCLKNIFN